jgi:YVTN family beta-propeller protein
VEAGATQLDVPGGRDWLILAGGSAWAASDGVDRLDGSTGEVRRSLSLPGPTCLAMDAGYGAVWVGVCGTPMLMRVDARTARITAKVPLEVSDLLEESSVAAGAAGVWALSADGQLVTLDPRTNRVSVHRAPAGATALRAGFGALWVTSYDAGSLLRVDPARRKVVARIAVGAGPRFLAVGEGGIWVLNQFDGTVSRVDPGTNTVTATITVSDAAVEGGDIAAGGGSVWARVSDSLVARIDPGTNKVVARYGPSAGSGSVAADHEAVWVSAHDINAIWRLPAP